MDNGLAEGGDELNERTGVHDDGRCDWGSRAARLEDHRSELVRTENFSSERNKRGSERNTRILPARKKLVVVGTDAHLLCARLCGR
jgi:hypothetical protein